MRVLETIAGVKEIVGVSRRPTQLMVKTIDDGNIRAQLREKPWGRQHGYKQKIEKIQWKYSQNPSAIKSREVMLTAVGFFHAHQNFSNQESR